MIPPFECPAKGEGIHSADGCFLITKESGERLLAFRRSVFAALIHWLCAGYRPNPPSKPSGASATPRSTSRALALRIVTKRPRWPSALGRVESLMRSVTLTSLLGSAPVSPFGLIVEVMA